MLGDFFTKADQRAGGGFMGGMGETRDRPLEISFAPIGGPMWSEAILGKAPGVPFEPRDLSFARDRQRVIDKRSRARHQGPKPHMPDA